MVHFSEDLPSVVRQFAERLRLVKVVIPHRGKSLEILFLDKSKRSKVVHSFKALISSSPKKYILYINES